MYDIYVRMLNGCMKSVSGYDSNKSPPRGSVATREYNGTQEKDSREGIIR